MTDPAETLERWAARVAPTLDVGGWALLAKALAGASPDATRIVCPWSIGHGIQPGCIHCEGAGWFAIEKGRALIAHRDRVARERGVR